MSDLPDPAERSALPRHLARITWLMVGVGVVLRLAQYLWNTGFWHDEAWLLINIVDRSYAELAGPLKQDQAAPLLYLWLLKLLHQTFGLNEWAMRAPSVLASIAAMIAIVPLARRTLRPEGVPWAVAAFAGCDLAIHYARWTKPYTIDALVTIGLLYLATRRKNASPAGYILPLGLAAAGAFWISYPSCFVYGGIALLGAGKLLRSRRPIDWIVFVAVNLLVAASILGHLHVIGGQRTEFLHRYWGIRGFWAGIGNIDDWPFSATFRLFARTLDVARILGAVMFAIGIVDMARTRRLRWSLGLLGLPMLLNMVAGALWLYPWVGGRLTLYITPAVMLLVGAGFPAAFRAIPQPRVRLVARLACVAWLGVHFGMWTVHLATTGHLSSNGRPLARHVLESYKPGDTVAVIGAGEFTMYFYDRYKRGQMDLVGGLYYRKPAYFELKDRTWDRMWLLVRADNDLRRQRSREVIQRAAEVLDKRESFECELYLLGPSGPPPDAPAEAHRPGPVSPEGESEG